MTDPTSPQPTTSTARFGTFAGVFTPNVLTILGIILFLRTGWVVGQAGLWGALVIILLANAISFLTGLSLSSIATSMDVRAGGNYYLISRSLGLEIGGAIGIPLYLSQAISVAFYIIGFVEAMSAVPFMAGLDPQLLATGVAVAFAGIAYVGADFALKIQFGILAVLVAALVSFFAGGWGDISAPTAGLASGEGVSFWVVFAVFFPAVTGIEVGISLSGDLKDPSRSIPVGTIASILVTSVVYVAAAVWFATHFTAEELVSNTAAMSELAAVPILILAGVAASQLFNALTSYIVTTSGNAQQARDVMFWLLGTAAPVVGLSLAALLVLKALGKRLDPRQYNGASFVGLNGIVIKSHGGADVVAFANAIRVAALEAEKDVPNRIAQMLAHELNVRAEQGEVPPAA